MLAKRSQITSIKFASLYGHSSPVAIFTSSSSNLTGRLEKNSLLRCDTVSAESVTGECSLAIEELSEEGVYVVTVVVVAEVVATALAESDLPVVVIVVMEASKCMSLLNGDAMWFNDVIVM
jgi:hypothetical protein